MAFEISRHAYRMAKRQGLRFVEHTLSEEAVAELTPAALETLEGKVPGVRKDTSTVKGKAVVKWTYCGPVFRDNLGKRVESTIVSKLRELCGSTVEEETASEVNTDDSK